MHRATPIMILGLCLAVPAWAGPGGPHGDRGPGFGPDRFAGHRGERAARLAEVLDLSAEQRAAAEKLHADHRAASRARFDEMRALRDELRDLLATPSPDPAAVGTRTIRLHALRDEMRAEREQLEAEFTKLLDERQKIAWETLDRARDEFGPRRDFRRHGPGPGRHGGRWGDPPPPVELD